VQSDFRIDPNPAKDHITVSGSSGTEQPVPLKIINLAGQTVFQETGKDAAGRYSVTVDVRGLQDGIYFVQMVTSERTLTKKLVVVH
jgi:hypothetical protein